MAMSDDLKLLNGSSDDKRELFNQLIDIVISGQALASYQIPMLEYLKTLFTTSGE
jgi:hypothetical protein